MGRQLFGRFLVRQAAGIRLNQFDLFDDGDANSGKAVQKADQPDKEDLSIIDQKFDTPDHQGNPHI